MNKAMPHYRWHDDTLLIYCQVQANARHDEFAGLSNERLKIRVTAAATEGAANKCLIKYLAAQFGIPKNRIALVKGQTTRYKTLALKAPKKIPEQTHILRA